MYSFVSVFECRMCALKSLARIHFVFKAMPDVCAEISGTLSLRFQSNARSDCLSTCRPLHILRGQSQHHHRMRRRMRAVSTSSSDVTSQAEASVSLKIATIYAR